MGTIPRVALGLGSVAGLGAAHLACSHYSVMVKEKSAVFEPDVIVKAYVPGSSFVD